VVVDQFKRRVIKGGHIPGNLKLGAGLHGFIREAP
jgi:hypothetical protein